MTPHQLLQHTDQGRPWPRALSESMPGLDLNAAYGIALQVRALRLARGEIARGFKLGFTNRSIWPRYGVYGPIWGTVWERGLAQCDGQGELSLRHTCEPRLEPEIVFVFKTTPPPAATLQQLFESLDGMAPGFEVVQSHLPGWKFQASDTVADGALHARLLVGPVQPLQALAPDAATLDTLLAGASVSLCKNGQAVDAGQGGHVLGSPLRALLDFVQALSACPGAPALRGGDLVSTGTWTDAWPVAPGEDWSADFSLPGLALALTLRD